MLNADKDDQYRFNWNTPFLLSPHNPSIIWLGGNRLFKSYNRGDTWIASADLTKQIDRNTIAMMGVPGDRTMLSKNDGVASYSTIIDARRVAGHAGRRLGRHRRRQRAGEPRRRRDVHRSGQEPPGPAGESPATGSRASRRRTSIRRVAYVAVDGHRSDDLKPYVFVTRDYGKTWRASAANLPPSGNVQVVREDPRNKDLLFVGTEFGLFVSLDGGKNWQKFMNNLPTVRVDDILVHPRDNDLIVATHGRSVWIADDITPLQQLTPAVRDAGRDAVRHPSAWRGSTISRTASRSAGRRCSSARTRRAARRSATT